MIQLNDFYFCGRILLGNVELVEFLAIRKDFKKKSIRVVNGEGIAE